MDTSVYEMERPQRDDSSDTEEDEEDNHGGLRRVNAAVKAFAFIMKQSYICALIAMMVRCHTHYTAMHTTTLGTLVSKQHSVVNKVKCFIKSQYGNDNIEQ